MILEKEEEKRPPKTTTMHPMFTTKEKKREKEKEETNNAKNINDDDAKRVAEATTTIDLTKGGEHDKTTTNLNKDIQKFCCTKQEKGTTTIVDLTREKDNDDEKEKTRTEEQPPQKVHSFFQKRKPQAKSTATVSATVPGASRKTPYEEAVKHLPPIHVNCPIRTVVGAHTEDVVKGYGVAFENAVAFAAERRRSLVKSSSASTGASFRWRYEIKSDDEIKDEEMSIETEEKEEEIEEEIEPNDEYSRAIINRLESQFRAASKGTPWVEICKPTRASETLGSQNSQPADLCRNWLTNWKARIESNKNASKHTFRNARRQHTNNNHSDSEDSDAKWEREMGMELSDEEDDEEGEKNDGFGDGSGANIANGLIVFGDSGSGKTATIRAVASELGFSILEVNAGQNRSGRDILERFGESLQSKNLLNKRKKPSSDAAKTITEKKKMEETEEATIPTDINDDEKMTTMTSEEPKKKKKTANGKKAQKAVGNKTLFGFVKMKEATNGGVDDSSEKKKKKKKEAAEQEKQQEQQQQQKGAISANNTVVVFEDIDCLFGNEDEEAKDVDRGLIPAIATLLEAAKRPIVVVCKSEEMLDGDDGQLRQLTSLGTSTTRVGFEKPTVEELAKYLRLCCLAKAKASSPSEEKEKEKDDVYPLSTSKGSLSMSHCLKIAKLRKGDIRGALNDCEVMSAAPPGRGKSIAFKEKGLFAAGDDETTDDFLFDVALPLLNDAYANGALPVAAVAFTEKISKDYEAKENAFVAKYAEKCDARFLEYSLKENEKREKAKAERRKKKLQALGLKESQVDPDITAWKDLEEEEGREEKNSEDPSAMEKEKSKEEKQEERKVDSIKCTPVKNEQREKGAMVIAENEDNNDGEGRGVKEGTSPHFSQQNLDIPPSPLTSAPEVAEASVESAEFWETHVQRMNSVSNLSSIQTSFDALMRPKPFGANGVPLSLKPGVLARYIDYCDTFNSDTKETQFIDEDFLLTGGEPRKQFGDERKRVSSQCIDVGLQRFKENVVGTVLREGGFTDAAAIDFTERARKEGEKKATSDENDILFRQREHATLLNPKLASSNSVSLATYVGFASKIAKARFQPTALDTPGETRTRRAKLSMHLDKVVGVREQERIANLSNFNR